MPRSDYLEAVLLGVVQGIAEFLPISSSGHLVILQQPLEAWLGTAGTPDDNLRMNVALHFGTLLSILLVYRTEVWALLGKPRLCAAIVVASIPAGAIGLTLKDWLEQAFSTPLVAGCGLLVTAALLQLGQTLERNLRPLDELRLRDALAIGCFQAVALIPGISRSGSTIAAGLLCGLRRETAAAFSFLIAIPVIAGATLLEVVDMWTQPAEAAAGHAPSVLLVGALVSFLVGTAALRGMIRLVTQRRLHWFAGYCVVVGAITIAWQLSRG